MGFWEVKVEKTFLSNFNLSPQSNFMLTKFSYKIKHFGEVLKDFKTQKL